jgi:signal transduction histidine kinase
VAGGHITVQARRNGTQLTVEVTDTGAGLAELPASHDGFGLAQIRARLAATHGDKSALELIAAPAGGTLARVTFPC